MGGWRIMNVLLAATLALQIATEATAAIHAYIPDADADTVWRFDLASNEAVPITVGLYPIAVDASADGQVVVVVSSGQYPSPGSAAVIEGATASVRWTVPVGSLPRGVGVTPDGSKAYVSNYENHSVSVIDTATGTVSKTIPLDGTLDGVAMSPNGQRVYVAQNSFAGTVVSIDTTTDQIAAEILVSLVSRTTSITTDPSGAHLFVGLESGVAIVDAATNVLIDDVDFGCDQGCSGINALATSADGSRVYASRMYSGGAMAVDVATLAYEPLPSSVGENASTTGVDLSPDGSTLYVVDTLGTIDLIDTATETVRATLIAIAHNPIAFGEFIAGPTPPVVPAPPPQLGSAARACQKAVLDSFKTFAAKSHQLLSGCLQRIQKDHATGAVTSGTTTACARDVDPASPTSRLAKARALAKQRIASGCATATPAMLGTPCDAGATTIGALADCALDRQLAGVTSTIAGEVAASCGLLELAGLGSAFPALCP